MGEKADFRVKDLIPTLCLNLYDLWCVYECMCDDDDDDEYVNGYTKYLMYSSSVKTQNPILKWESDIVVEQMPPRGLYLAPAAFTNTPLVQFNHIVYCFH